MTALLRRAGRPGTAARLVVLVACALGVLAGAAACAPPSPQVTAAGVTGPGATDSGSTANASAGASASTGANEVPYDILPLLAPRHKYLGVASDGSPRTSAPVRDFAEQAGKRPNLREYYVKWGDPFQPQDNRAVWDDGQLPFLVWEPFTASAAQIAAGRQDAYIRSFADAIRDYNRPLALSFGHEMNGGWYPWGSRTTKAADFVAAWRHIHDLFTDEGAANVIWVWSPNVINPVPDVRLRPYYPGDNYVDWVGVVGYYALTGPRTFGTLFGPTLEEVRHFTAKPFLVAETGAQAGPGKPAEISGLFKGVAARDDILGLVWFNLKKEADWRINSGPASLAAFRRAAASDSFSFDVRKP